MFPHSLDPLQSTTNALAQRMPKAVHWSDLLGGTLASKDMSNANQPKYKVVLVCMSISQGEPSRRRMEAFL